MAATPASHGRPGAADGDRIRVLIADDHPVYRSGLRMLLADSESVCVVGEAGTGAEVLSMARELRPQLIIMDVNLPSITGIEATKTLASRHPEIAVIVVTMLDDTDTFFAAMRAGARGFLLKEANSEELALAIRVVQYGGLVFGAHASDWVVDHLTKPQTAAKPFPELTDREQEILALVADGHGNAAIARMLGPSTKTVRNYLSRIFVKLRIADRTEAAVGRGVPGWDTDAGRNGVPLS